MIPATLIVSSPSPFCLSLSYTDIAKASGKDEFGAGAVMLQQSIIFPAHIFCTFDSVAVVHAVWIGV